MRNPLPFLSVFGSLLFLYSCNSEEEERLYDEACMETRAGEPSTWPSPTDTFPSITTIINDSVVKNAMEAAWKHTLILAFAPTSDSQAGRQEIGFYIYYDFNTKSFFTGERVYGDPIFGCIGTHGSINLGAPKYNQNVCAFFHTHTPLTYCPPEARRETGPSREDRKTAQQNGLPGVLIDYSVDVVEGGYPLDSPYQYYTFGVKRRKNPLTP